MEINENDKKLLEMIGVIEATDEEKQTILAEIDQKMSERFIANLLNTMDAESAKKLQEELDSVPNDDPEKVISKIITSHPDASSILEKTSREVMDEFKKARETKLSAANDVSNSEDTTLSGIDAKPPIEEAAPKEPDVASGTLADTSTSELDKNISELKDDEPSATVEAPKAPEPPVISSEPESPAPSEVSAPAAPQDDGPLNVSFSNQSASTEPAIETKEETVAGQPASAPGSEPAMPPSPEIEKSTDQTSQTEQPTEVQETPPAISTEEPPAGPAQTPADDIVPAQPSSANETPEVNPSPSPTDNPAPWSFSSEPAQSNPEPTPASQPEPDNQPAPVADSAPAASPTPSSTAPATAPTPPTSQDQPPTSISDLYK